MAPAGKPPPQERNEREWKENWKFKEHKPWEEARIGGGRENKEETVEKETKKAEWRAAVRTWAGVEEMGAASAVASLM